MPSFRNISVKRKLQTIILLTSTAALLLSCLAFLLSGLYTLRLQVTDNVSILAEVIGSNSVAALTFNDPNSARENLRGLRAQSHIMTACLYTPDRHVFASYRRDGVAANFEPPAVLPDQVRFTSGSLFLFESIFLHGQAVGIVPGIRPRRAEFAAGALSRDRGGDYARARLAVPRLSPGFQTANRDLEAGARAAPDRETRL